MAGFDRKEKEEFGVRHAKQGEWYSYALMGQGHTQGRFSKQDEAFIYFDKAPAEAFKEDGIEWVLKEGEIAVPLHSIATFYSITPEEVNRSLAVRNWHRNYINEWVAVQRQLQDLTIGKVVKAFSYEFELFPYISQVTKKIVETGKPRLVLFGNAPGIEVLSEQTVREKFE